MTLDVAISLINRFAEKTYRFHLVADGYGKFSVEIVSRKGADEIFAWLRTLGHKPNMLMRPGFYCIS